VSWWWLCASLSACIVAGCAGTETGNPSFSGTLGYDAYTSEPTRVALRLAEPAAHGEVVVDAAWLVLGDVAVLHAGECQEPAEAHTHVPGLGAGDHAGTQAPASTVELTAGRYCGVRLPFVVRDALPAGAPDALRAHSILITGTLADGRSFSVASARSSEVLVASNASFELDAQRAGVVIGFDVAHWLAQLPWPAATTNMEAVTVDADHNPDVLSAFEAQLAAGVELFRDADGDGMLDSEHEPIASGAN
jgi:hypothetical protein